jgi:hypothetical protein
MTNPPVSFLSGGRPFAGNRDRFDSGQAHQPPLSFSEKAAARNCQLVSASYRSISSTLNVSRAPLKLRQGLRPWSGSCKVRRSRPRPRRFRIAVGAGIDAAQGLLFRSSPNADRAVETRAVRDTVTVNAAAQRIECHTHVRADPPPGNNDPFEPAARAV